MKKLLPAVFIIVLLLTIFVACGADGTDDASKEAVSALSVGLMPAVDSAPILLAAERGYFEQEGVEVELEIYTNAQNRQSALQSGKLDGAITDLVALTTNVAGDFDIKATTLTSGMFIVLAREGSMEEQRVTVGTMEVSVTNYLLDRWMKGRYNMDKVYINEIPLRLEALAGGKLDMGIFPEPLASVGASKGLEKLDFAPPEGYWPDALVFTKHARTEKRAAVEAFHRAYNTAVEAVYEEEATARSILVEKIPQLQPDIRDALTMPDYRRAFLPEDEYLQSIIDWTGKTVDRSLEVSAEDLVDRSFVE